MFANFAREFCPYSRIYREIIREIIETRKSREIDSKFKKLSNRYEILSNRSKISSFQDFRIEKIFAIFFDILIRKSISALIFRDFHQTNRIFEPWKNCGDIFQFYCLSTILTTTRIPSIH